MQWVEAVAGVLGDYAQTTPTKTLLEASRAGGASGDVARLRGARMVQCNEFPECGHGTRMWLNVALVSGPEV